MALKYDATGLRLDGVALDPAGCSDAWALVRENRPSLGTEGAVTLPESVESAVRALASVSAALAEKVAANNAVFAESVRQEVEQRIRAVASTNTQINMSAAAAAGALSESQMDTFREALAWVSEVRVKGADLIEIKDSTFKDNAHWPEPTAAVVALVSEF